MRPVWLVLGDMGPRFEGVDVEFHRTWVVLCFAWGLQGHRDTWCGIEVLAWHYVAPPDWPISGSPSARSSSSFAFGSLKAKVSAGK
jgi:hypothetical protein